jgi:3-oxoacyl-[acyl-carrier-protein] synthase III
MEGCNVIKTEINRREAVWRGRGAEPQRPSLHAAVIGSGVGLPPFRVSNETVGAFFPPPGGDRWTPKWVETQLGINTRISAFDFDQGLMREGYFDGDNAFKAAAAAIADAAIAPAEVDRVLYATSTPELLMPDPACQLHRRLGLRPDASAIAATAVGCGGFIYLMDIADSEIRSGKYRTILIVGSVSVAPYIQAIATSNQLAERKKHLEENLVNAYIFGEGAGAMVFQACDGQSGILHTVTGASGDDNPVLFKGGGSRHPATHETVSQGLHRFHMDVGLVRRVGPKHFLRTVEQILDRSGTSLKDFDHFIFHQVNPRLLRAVTANLGIPWERVIVHVERYGNLDTATLPVAYHEARASERIRSGDLVLFAAIGAGWQYGAAIVRV